MLIQNCKTEWSLGMVADTCNSSSQKAESGWFMISGQLRLPGKTLCHLKTGRKKEQQDDPDVKMFATKHRDLSLEPQHPHKRLDIVAQVYKPMLRR